MEKKKPAWRQRLEELPLQNVNQASLLAVLYDIQTGMDVFVHWTANYTSHSLF